MARKNVRVSIPKNSPDAMLTLAQAIIKKHESFVTASPAPAPTGATAPSEESPLHHVDMRAFKTKTEKALKILTLAREHHSSAEGFTQEAYFIMGFSKGQTIQSEGSLYFLADNIRAILLSEHKETEEKLEEWGFNVLVNETKKRRTVSVPLPVSQYDKFMALCNKIIKKHEEMGDDSPLHHIDMIDFKSKTGDAEKILVKARELHKKAEGETQEARLHIGISKGQRIHTRGTLYATIDLIRLKLLAFYKPNEEKLQEWGFVVVISETVPGKKTKTVTLVIPAGQQTVQTKVISGSKAENIGFTVLEWWEGSMPSTTTTQFAPDQFSTINAPSGIITIRNLSLEDTGRCKVKVKI